MFPVSRISRFAFAFAALLAVLFSAQAGADPAGRVGRVALLDGPTLFRVDRADAGSPASVNWPVSSGAIFDTERGSRAEIWVGSTAFRLAGETRLEFSVIDDRLITLQLATGTLSVVVRDREQAADLDLRLPDGRVQFLDAGRYRIDVGPERSSIVADAGQAVVHAGNGSLTVGPGRTADLDAGGRLALYGESARDAFDDWVAERDSATRVRAASRYVSPQMTGYQDLDGYGDWDTVSDYGTVWYPRAVPTGWAPYRYGRWAWVAPWGWTWVDAAPWGFAPFHYGRWIEVRGRWGWVPGRYVPRPVYAPALVAWIGNAGWSIGLSAGRAPAVGWFPLAPREVYVPSYRASTTYVRQINVTQITNVTVINQAVAGRGERRFANRASPRAVTVVPVGTVREGRAVAAAALPVRDQRELRQAPLSARAPTGNWLAPDTAATRPQGERGERRERGAPAFAQPGGRCARRSRARHARRRTQCARRRRTRQPGARDSRRAAPAECRGGPASRRVGRRCAGDPRDAPGRRASPRHRTAPAGTAPGRSAADGTGANRSTAGNAAAGGTAPIDATPGGSRSGGAATPSRATSIDAAPDGTAPGRATPGNPTAGGTASVDATPGRAAASGATSGRTTAPVDAAPERTAPAGATADRATQGSGSGAGRGAFARVPARRRTGPGRAGRRSRPLAGPLRDRRAGARYAPFVPRSSSAAARRACRAASSSRAASITCMISSSSAGPSAGVKTPLSSLSGCSLPAS